jgi:rhamnosyltransferase
MSDAPPASVSDPAVVTVFIPTFNGERYLAESLDAVLGQRLPDAITLDVLVIDSGSTDGTLAVLGQFADRIRLHRIPNREFSHGGTRDLAARLARGALVVFLTQDATPAHDRWLIKMIEPFALSPRIGCVYGGQRPRETTAVSIRREVSQTFERRTGEVVVALPWSLVDGAEEHPPDPFFSDVNSAARRDLLIGEVPFRHVDYAEDQALAIDMQQSGYLKVYAFDACVWHSNEYSARKFFQRKLDEYVGRALSLQTPLHDSWGSLVLGWIRPTVRDWGYLAREDVPWVTKFRGVFDAPLYNIAAKAARFRASRALPPLEPAWVGDAPPNRAD